MHWAVMAWLIQINVQALAATLAGAAVGSIVNYLLQFYWSFSGATVHHRALPAYLCTVIAGWGLNAGAFYTLVSLSAIGIGPAQIMATASVAIMNFILYKRFVFHERNTRKLAS